MFLILVLHALGKGTAVVAMLLFFTVNHEHMHSEGLKMALLTMRGNFIITSLCEDKTVLAWVLRSLNQSSWQ